MEKLPGEAKDIAYHQNCNKYEYYFSGDRQLFEVLYKLNLHQYLNMTILILLLREEEYPIGGEVVGRMKNTYELIRNSFLTYHPALWAPLLLEGGELR